MNKDSICPICDKKVEYHPGSDPRHTHLLMCRDDDLSLHLHVKIYNNSNGSSTERISYWFDGFRADIGYQCLTFYSKGKYINSIAFDREFNKETITFIKNYLILR